MISTSLIDQDLGGGRNYSTPKGVSGNPALLNVWRTLTTAEYPTFFPAFWTIPVL